MVSAGGNERTFVLTAVPSLVASKWEPVLGAARTASRCIDLATQAVAALLLAAEVLLLGSSVVARYVIHQPLIWSDELAVMVLLWLAILGATLALRRGDHLRLTVLVQSVSPSWRDAMEVVSALLAILFALILIWFGLDYIHDEAFLRTPALQISGAWRAAALPVGGALMLEAALARLIANMPQPRALATAFLATGAAVLILWVAADPLSDLGNWNLLLFFAGFVSICLLLGLPIAFAFGLVTLAYLGLTTMTPLGVVLGRMDGGMSNIILMAIPLFVLLGKLMEATGMARKLVGFLACLVGHLRGGLSYALLAAMYVVSGISGAKAADMAAVAPILFPEMRQRGGNEGEMVSLLAASAVMSETIPPSLVLIAIATSVGVSIAALFTAGLLPAFIAAIALCGLVYWRSRGEPRAERPPTLQVLARALLVALPGLILPFVIRAAVVEGVATATEVSTVGIAYVAVVALVIDRAFPWRQLIPMLVDTAVLSGALLLVLGTANAMAWALTQSGFSDELAQVLTHMPGGRYGFLALAMLVFIVFGSVLEGLPAIALFGPLLFPISRALGIDDVHFAIVAIMAMGVGLYMPPFGVGFYAACAIGGVNPDQGMRRIWPYLGLLLGATILIAAVPFFSTCFLP
jgi:tripartite ATP-independent transporter DctM subunit